MVVHTPNAKNIYNHNTRFVCVRVSLLVCANTKFLKILNEIACSNLNCTAPPPTSTVEPHSRFWDLYLKYFFSFNFPPPSSSFTNYLERHG